MMYNGTALIQAVGLVYQAVTGALSVSKAVEATETGGLLQSPAPTQGLVNCTTTMSKVTTAFEATAFLLAASGIRCLNWRLWDVRKF